MMNALQILGDNSDFVMGIYSIGAFMSAFFLLILIDMGLKGWGMWRASRMEKKSWFIALLIVHSMGILPIIFLLITREEYAKQKNDLATRNSTLEMER